MRPSLLLSAAPLFSIWALVVVSVSAMEEAASPSLISTTGADLISTIGADSRTILFSNRRPKLFLYSVSLAFLACTSYLAFWPAAKASPWLSNLSDSAVPCGSEISSLFSRIFTDSSSAGATSSPGPPSRENQPAGDDGLRTGGLFVVNRTNDGAGPSESPKKDKGQSSSQEKGFSGKDEPDNVNERGGGYRENGVSEKNEPDNVKEGEGESRENRASRAKETEEVLRTRKGDVLEEDGNSTEDCKVTNDQGRDSENGGDSSTPNRTKVVGAAKNGGSSLTNRNSNSTANPHTKNGCEEKIEDKDVSSSAGNGREKVDLIAAMEGCNLFHGRWVKDDSFPLYPEGSCPHIDEPFDCYDNGRPDRAYQKLRWLPNGCDIPRMNATDMLERLRGKRVVFVGDSLNRNMWESLVCILRNVLEDKRNVFEKLGRNKLRAEGSYAFVFKDFDCSVEFFRSPFLVQEWEAPRRDGQMRETLRLDMVERTSSLYKDADVIVYNTGHWWTHDKTFEGKDYYQEGNHIYSELNVEEAFRRAVTTWARWVDANVNPKKSLVFFRGYSVSHFSGGRWNSGGQCDGEITPIEDEKYLSAHPTMMTTLESVISTMKTPVSYLNVTRMTDYRKDAHPSIYTAPNLTDVERRAPGRHQDCSHWCLPGVPDSWNELLYALLLKREHQMQ